MISYESDYLNEGFNIADIKAAPFAIVSDEFNDFPRSLIPKQFYIASYIIGILIPPPNNST